MARGNRNVTAPETVVQEPEMEKVVQEPREATVQTVELKRRALLETYKNEKKRAVNISPMYAKYFGKVMTIAINGITIAIPCNGKTYKVPETHAIEALARIHKVDASITRRDRMQDISNNVETSPGELNFY